MNAPVRPAATRPNVPAGAEFDCALAALLARRKAAWNGPWNEESSAGFLDRARHHGVAGLLAETQAGLPTSVRSALREQAIAQWLWQVGHERALRVALDALGEAGAQPIVFKGSALAYSHYRSPGTRARADSDVIVRPAAREIAARALRAAGFEPAVGVVGELVSTQHTYVREVDGVRHAIDLHWRFSNSVVLSSLLSHEELAGDAVPVPVLGPCGWAPKPSHALLIAIVHRAAHRTQPLYGAGGPFSAGDRLIWLYDIHLLANSLDSRGEAEFINLAGRAFKACVDALDAANACFGTAPLLREALRRSQSRGEDRVSAYLDATPVRQWWLDFRALGTTARRVTHLRESLLPGEDYMRAKYSSGSALPVLYARRALGGLAKAVRWSRA